ncbi:MAG: hypothetical protein LBH09_06620 [Peptococcaceae bacterium]|jgi:hypothetical protein|nr:hypothetical protein [Peptococcaceae bacterium]
MELVISEFDGEIQQRILDRMKMEYFSTGKFVKDQMSVSPKVWSSLILASGTIGTIKSAAISSTLFMATENPAKLMELGSGGLGSAVMGTHGIVRQAGFIPVASSIPVVAPLMAAQALSSVAILQQLSVMDKKLDVIKGAIDIILARQEVTKVAELFAAVHMIDEIYSQYSQAGHFSTDMLIRLALAEHDAMILTRRYEMLDNSAASDTTTKGFDNYDSYCTMLASFLNLRVKNLRTCVDIQENPQFVQNSAKSFISLLDYNINLWDQLLRKSDKMKDEIEALAAQVENANALQKITQSSKRVLSRKKDEYTALMEKERIIIKDFHSLIDIAKQISETANEQALPTLFYWHDDEGEHCIATNENMLDAFA